MVMRRKQSGALQLVADVAILLNLIFSRIAEEGCLDVRASEAVLGGLPPCLSTSADRSEVFEGCDENCKAGLCTFPERSIRAAARGDLSRRFCELQSEVVLKGRRPPWHSSIESGSSMRSGNAWPMWRQQEGRRFNGGSRWAPPGKAPAIVSGPPARGRSPSPALRLRYTGESH
jgi:hypothetical protein